MTTGKCPRRSVRILGAVAVALAWTAVGAHALAAQDSIEWHGYSQLRYGRSDPWTGFGIRRGKLWMTGPVPGAAHLSFHVQGIFRTGAAGAFVIQDLFADYVRAGAKLRVGQLVPAFSLERSQPDYRVPLIERAAVVETLIPGARTMGREVGAQVFVTPGTGALQLDVGLFDGSGGNRPPGGSGDFLTTGRLTLATQPGSGVKASIGGSLAWRRTHGTDVGVLSSAGSAFAGTDLRWGGDARLAGRGWEVQGEYLHADLEGEVSRGFYVLAGLAVRKRDEVAVSVEQMTTPATVRSDPWYIAGFTHLLGDNDITGRPDAFPTRLMADVRCRFADGAPTVEAGLQLQVFLH